MPKIKHIAIATQDADATAKFYTEVFGMREIAKLDSPNASGYYLSDGNINLAILDFKNDQVTGLEEIAEKLQKAGSHPRDDINQALGVGMGGEAHANVEVKYSGPNGEIIDVSQTGWVGTRGFD